MLKITNHSENYDGAIELNGKEVAGINGSVNQDNIYMNFNSYNVAATKESKSDVAADVAEFVDILLSGSGVTPSVPASND